MDGAPKGFAAGRGLLAAADTLNFNVNEQRPIRQMGGGVSGGGGVEEQESGSRVPRGGGHLGGTMKLFASLGLSPSDLDALAQIPEEDISVETLPQILMQLKNRKAGRGPSSAPPDEAYRGGGGRMGAASFGMGSGSSDFGFASPQGASLGRGMRLNFGGGGGSRERSYSELSLRDSYGGPQGALLSQPAFTQPRRKGSPSQGKVQDFLGAPPPRFPHVCSLCDFDVHSNMEWTQHTNGLRHAENRRVLLNMYPEWDPSGAPGRSGAMESTNLSAGLLGPAPSAPGPGARMLSSWGPGPGLGLGMSGQNRSGSNVMRSRVVVVKYDRRPLSNKTLFAFAEPFGRLQEHLVLKTKAFLEMETHEEALDMVNFYERKPATLYGKPITFYLSKRLMVIQKDERSSDRPPWPPRTDGPGRRSQVVFFSNLPREVGKKEELLTIAARFGVVEKHLFLTDQAFIQLGTFEDAEMMVKYYTVNPLTIKGRAVRLNICTKYKTLNIDRRHKEPVGGGSSRRAGTQRRPSRSLSRSPSRSRDEENGAKSASEDEEEVAGVVEGEGEDLQSESGVDGEEKPSETPAETEETDGGDGGIQKAPEEHVDDVTKDDMSDETPGDDGSAVEKGVESEEQRTEAGSGVEQATEEDDSFLENMENMEDFVTLDELPDDDEKEAEDVGQSGGTDTSRKGGLRVVNILGFRRGYKFLDELLGLATPFGKVVKHLVLDWRPEAFLQFATEEEARAMAKFYNGNVMPSVCGRPVRVNHSLTYPTIQVRAASSTRGVPTGEHSVDHSHFLSLQCGASRVVYVGQLPNSKYEDEDVLKLAEPFGKVKKYFLNPIKRECFLEMEKAEAADEMAQTYKTNQAKLNGRRLLIYVSRKYTQLKYGHSCPSATTKRGPSSSPPKSSKPSEEPPAKKTKEEEERKKEEEKKPQEEEEPKELKSQEEEEQQKAQDEEELKEEEEKPEEELEADQKKRQEEEEQMESQEQEDVLSSHQKTEVDTTANIPDFPDQKQNSSLELTEEEPVVAMETSAHQNKESAPPASETKTSAASLPLLPFDPEKAIGVEHIKLGYYCRVCLLFYSNEDMAKKTHCSSQTHYDKLQKHLEKEQGKAEKKRAKKTSA
ncbi:matrin 3-like 1.2 isoform X1 [Phycodurus eques]|uniref:matrin 3-like 1.2 isoform X1 n=1 Tax=Phycodurus eques TaxID=693459 RepID=UPI002ACD3E3B|nr:matrin 3-like 1.2 isoform X1 [Phycodurus eques]